MQTMAKSSPKSNASNLTGTRLLLVCVGLVAAHLVTVTQAETAPAENLIERTFTAVAGSS